MSQPAASLAMDCKAILGESPVGLSNGELWFIDINGRRVLCYDSVAGVGRPEEIRTTQMVGCLAPRAKGGLVAGLEDCLVAVDPAASEVHAHTPLLRLPANVCGTSMRFNDGECDAAGRLFGGIMHTSWRDPSAPRGSLLRIALREKPHADAGADACADADAGEEGRPTAAAAAASDPSSSPPPLSLSVAVPDVRLSNGIVFTNDSLRMFYIDSAERTVDCFDYDLSSSSLTNRRTIITFSSDEPGVPDGMCLDASGHLWVVVGESGSVRQVDVQAGREVAALQLPVQRPTSCGFGGADLSHLYVTTREEKGASASTHAGGLFRCLIPGVKGAAFSNAFAG